MTEHAAPVVEPLPDRVQVAREHTSRRDNVERHPLPHSRVAAAAERRHAALGGHARARQHEDAARRMQALSQLFVDVRLLFDGHRIGGMVAEEGKSKKAKGKSEDEGQGRAALNSESGAAPILTAESRAVFPSDSFSFCLFPFAFFILSVFRAESFSTSDVLSASPPRES